jgi:hypothetical protein
VTLGFILATNSGIHQSADLRLTDLSGNIYKDPSPKALVLANPGWFGIITFAGIGAITTSSTTSDWIAQVLVDLGAGRSIDETAEHIRGGATASFRNIRREWRRHTFVLSGVVNGRPSLRLISNWEFANGKQLKEVESEFFISSRSLRRPTKDPALIVVGWYPGVKNQDRIDLKWAVRVRRDAQKIRERMAEINTRVAETPAAAARISGSCIVFSLLPDGHVWGELYGEPQEKLMFRCINNGQDTTSISEKVFYDQYPGKVPVFPGVTLTHQRNAYGMIITLRPHDPR